MNILELESVSKTFGSVKAVSNVSFTLPEGAIYGLLGPNGSGKSTTMKMILGLIKPDSGVARVLGKEVSRHAVDIKKVVGYVPETPRLYEFLSGVEYLDFVGDIYGLSPPMKKQRIEEFLSALELDGQENHMISGYSHGMKQKIAITAALIHRPKLLVLDEPLNGLDPRAARIVKDLLHRLAEEGVTTLFSTHVLGIAEAMCDRLIVMYHGSVLAEGTISELKEKAGFLGSSLEDAFLKLTGSEDTQDIVEALLR